MTPSGQWRDTFCWEKLWFICEAPNLAPTTTPPPTTEITSTPQDNSSTEAVTEVTAKTSSSLTSTEVTTAANVTEPTDYIHWM